MIVIFGGTGTLGHALAEIIDKKDLDCTIVSRCEVRQKEMQKLYPKFKFVIGDVTNKDWCEQLPRRDIDTVFNLAAMKHVDLGETNVRRCVEINYGGAVKTFQWAQSVGAYSYVFSGTDKAVLPINAYGMAKGLAMRYLNERSEIGSRICISTFIWGNVLGSRGSFLPQIRLAIELGKPVQLTDRRMTRFWVTIEDVANFMWQNRYNPSRGEPHIPPMKAAAVERVIAAVADGHPYQIEVTGLRPGEKIHECIRTGHDYCITSENCEQYSDDELKELVRDFTCRLPG